ncbi:MAG TPA: FAD:protein FMN transferase [Bacteroidales bacterium]|nr:FAD:protein FMN transferase [Bacteroidales bacterium]HQK69014.1 FAD:protein FMN transferase [Bacteroidales bacterium]
MKKSLTGTLIIMLIISLSCKEKELTFSDFNGFTQGTTYSITYENPGNISPEELQFKVETILYRFDMSLSLYQDSSIVTRINRNENAVPDSFFIDVFSQSKKIWELTGGAFDITVGPLVKAWGFGPDEVRGFKESARDSLLALVGMEKVSLKDGIIIKEDPRVSLDFNAIAQGYSVDVIARFFDGLGIKRYLVEIGGEVRVKGDRGGRSWRIGIDRPEDNNMIAGQELQAIISLKDRSLATSGNYRKFYVENGIKYSHTIDPKTGYPAKNQLLSATILANDCATADGVATACMVMGKDKTIDFLSKHPEFEGFLVYSDDSGNFRTWMSESLKKNISESN